MSTPSSFPRDPAPPRAEPSPIPGAAALETRLALLERRVARGRRLGAALSLALLVALLPAMRVASGDEDGLLHVRGVVVEDALGRPRVVLGAPISKLAGRERSDPSLGLLLLDEHGRDLLSLGAPNIDPRVGGRVVPRRSPGTGLVINDGDGNERAGFSRLADGSVVLGLDHDQGEGIALFINPSSGYQGLVVNGPTGEGDRQRLFLGTSLDGDRASGGVLVLNNEDASRHSMFLGQGADRLPAWQLYSGGEVVRDLATQAAPQAVPQAPGDRPQPVQAEDPEQPDRR